MEFGNFYNSQKEKLNVIEINSEKSEFKQLKEFVIYFNTDITKNLLSNLISENIIEINKILSLIGRHLIIVDKLIIDEEEIQQLNYLYPGIEHNKSSHNNSSKLLNYISYSGKIKTGLLLHKNTISNKETLKSNGYILKYNEYVEPELVLIELVDIANSNDLLYYFSCLVEHLKSNDGLIFKPVINKYISQLASPIFYSDDVEINDEDKEAIKKIVEKLNSIKAKENYLTLLPIIDNYLKEQSKKETKLSKLFIDQEYKIYLTDYNVEVKLSHLTKTIYFFFLLMKDGIHISELSFYKTELLNIYLSVSNQDDYDKMSKSIELLLNDKNAIYVHLSRIKGAFNKLICHEFAKSYCVTGEKDLVKTISIPRELTNIHEISRQWKIKF